MRCCDLIVRLLVDNDINTFFTVTGGAIAPLVDAVQRCEDSHLVAFQHEQAAAMACEGYFRATRRCACVIVTSGPGVQNIMNGVCGAWYDSIPIMVITGQVNTVESLDAIFSKPRQRGFQEMPVVESFSPYTLYAKKLRYSHDALGREVVQTFTECMARLRTPRYGPVLVDLPVNIQMTSIDDVEAFDGVSPPVLETSVQPALVKQIRQIFTMLKESSRPLLVFGAAIRSSGSEKLVKKLVEFLEVPFTLSWGAKDLFPHDHAGNCGCHGVYGSRPSNFAVQNADFLLVVGSRLDTRQTGGVVSLFSRFSKKVIVDIDSNEIGKLVEAGMRVDQSIVVDVFEFLTNFAHLIHEEPEKVVCEKWNDWRAKIHSWITKYEDADIDKDKYICGNGMSAYSFLRLLSDVLPPDADIIPDTGAALVWAVQAIRLKEGQRFYTNLGNSSMGFSLPCCLGAALGTGKSRTIVSMHGDGGLQMNVQELKTAVDYHLPVKIFVLNNSGYGIIKQFQDLYFQSNYAATEFTKVDFESIAKSYGMRAIRIDEERNLLGILKSIFEFDGPMLIDVSIDPDQKCVPKLEFGNALEHLSPFIPLDDLKSEMVVETAERKSMKGWVIPKPRGAE